MRIAQTITISAAALVVTGAAPAQDWPQWGHDETRNMTCDVTGLPVDFAPGEFVGATDQIDFSTSHNVRWIAKLGSQSYGNPTVANGRVYVGTNNDSPRDPRFVGDRCCVYCLDEKTGAFIWQLNVPKLGTGKVSDWEFLGICSSPTIEGDRVYVLSNRCEVLCLDANGMADGNDGPFMDEGQYMAGPGNVAIEVAPTDADIIWSLNMIDECGVFPHNITSGSIVVAGDTLWVNTSNGVDYGHVETPAPNAPALITVNKKTGELIAEEQSGLSSRIFHSNWSSPSYWRDRGPGVAGGKELCIFGGPEGVCYAFRPNPVEDEDGWPILDLAWQFDCNPHEYRFKEDGTPRKYATRDGPSEILGTPIVANGLVYTCIGQDPEHGEGVGNFVCIDPTGEGDVTKTHAVWQYQKMNRSLSTPAVRNGLVFAADFSGFIYCLDAKTGDEYWVHDTMGHIWGSPLVADGKVYIGNEDGYLTILNAGKEKGEPIEIDMGSPVLASPIAANGTLYIATHTHLFAIAENQE